MYRQGQQVDEANNATADETNEAIGAGVSIRAIDYDDKDGALDNQLAELEKHDAANKAIRANCILLLDDRIDVIHYLQFSLTKYSAFFLEDKGYF